MWSQHHPKRHALSFKYAFEGVWYVLKTQANFRIHIVSAALALFLAFRLGFSSLEWIILVGVIGSILVLEMLNTILEVLVDHLWQEEHPRAKIIKDVAAGMVLLGAIGAIVIGVLLFGPYYL